MVFNDFVVRIDEVVVSVCELGASWEIVNGIYECGR